ncbi:MAG: bifunctional histidinol-phosphatase/imidazoleglycerol-phosphate dehydratase HisB [Gammaproteobacteria bacterium]|nr:MAG: bifunctional histidinol-phosphatase/imidazoleglycerol-phosphate dehydratase HisB [Gammaproteobacteria bacterium]
MATTRRIAFLDRDGTLIVEPPDEQVDSLDKFALLPGVIPALLQLRNAGFEFVMVSNQDGLGTPAFPREQFEPAQELLLDILASQGIEFSDILICPHRPQDGCHCRKPATGLLEPLLADPAVDRAGSVVIGDRESDLELARNAGIPGLRIDPADPGAWHRIADELTRPARRATVTRRTRETDIELSVDLDAEEPVEISTGIGFFDHMLEQVARHGGFALRLRCHGDLEVDEHHTVEDTALALGTALREALGDKRGIARYGFLLPMDEARAQVALDLSGRPYFVFEGAFRRDAVGGLPTELVPHFFRSLAESLGAALHLSVQGDNTHHMVESLFKATGRALRQAKAIEGQALPSTKGSL